MAKRKKRSSKKKPTFNPKTARPNYLLGSIFLILAILVFVSLLDKDEIVSISTDSITVGIIIIILNCMFLLCVMSFRTAQQVFIISLIKLNFCYVVMVKAIINKYCES